MADKKLIKDVNINNATCSGGSQKKTFVRVYKSGDVYKYKVSILCTDKTTYFLPLITIFPYLSFHTKTYI